KYKILSLLLLVPVAVIIISCDQTNYMTYDTDYNGIYFEKDSVFYSFGISPLEQLTQEVEIPVSVMGAPANKDRSFKVRVVEDKTTADKGTQFKMPDHLIIPKDSVNGVIAVELFRNELDDESDYKLTINLVENEHFTPINEKQKQILLNFNNKVVPPPWTDAWGDQTWPDFKLGPYNDTVYIKFLEFFRAMEDKAPQTYEDMVDEYGKNL